MYVFYSSQILIKTVVENIEKRRQPYPSLEAIYFLTPCLDSIYRLVDDFSTKPTYKAAHVHFTSGLSDEMFSELNQKLKSSGVSEYVLGLKELYVDFLVSESSVFTVDPTHFVTLFGQDKVSRDSSLRRTAKQLLSVCATLGQNPVIRYQTGNETTQKLAFGVQQEMDHFCSINPKFPPPQPRATLLILDRSIDSAAPLLHEFTYQAMLNDLLPIQETDSHVGIKYTYEFNQADGSLGSKDVLLDEEDEVYRSVRHMHIAQCSDHLIENFNQFLAENKVAGERETKSAAKNLKEMKNMLTNLPQFQDMKSKFSAHLNIAQECMSYFERHKLNSVGNLEQNMATSETADGETPKTVLLDMVPLLGDPTISNTDKARLLMLYIIWKENNVGEEEKQKLIGHAKLSSELRDAVNNLTVLGIKQQRVKRQERMTFMKKRRERKRNDEERPYELSRYVPIVKKVLDTHFTDHLDANQFGFTKEFNPETPTIPTQGVSLRTTKPTWSKKTNSIQGPSRSSGGAPLIVFILGGATYSEIRSVYELAETHQRDIFIGTTEILRPGRFVDYLSHLKQPAPIPSCIIPPYIPPSRPEVTKTTSFMSHISTSYLSNRTSTLSLSSTLSSEKTEEKKKKKGFKRFFG
ncbi:unnamed protein product [Rhizopus stolonifer]